MDSIKIPKASIRDQAVQKVQLDALVLHQIMKIGSGSSSSVEGRLIGVEEKGTLILTNSFAIPALNSPISSQVAASILASSVPVPLTSEDANGTTPPVPQTLAFEDESSVLDFKEKMIEILKEMEFEVNQVGWFSVYPGTSFIIQKFDMIIEQQFILQSENPQAIHLMYEPKRTEYQSPILTALRLTDEFMKFYATRNFGGKSVKTFGITPSNIFELLPIEIKNSHMMDAVFGEFDLVLSSPSDTSSLDEIVSSYLSQSASSNIISSEKYLERQLEALIDCVEDQGQEYWRWQAWHRGYHKEQQKVNSNLQKMNYENEKSTGAVVHDEAALAAASTSVGLGKSIAGEPGRLDTLFLSQHINMVSDHLSKFCA